MGKYKTKSADMTAASAVDLTEVPGDWKTSWSPAKKGAASLLLQAERKRDLIHAGKSAHQITEDSDTELFKSCDYQLAKLNDDMEAVYKYWLDVTGGDVREKVGWESRCGCLRGENQLLGLCRLACRVVGRSTETNARAPRGCGGSDSVLQRNIAHTELD